MNTSSIATDYLVIGAGATAMAFVDTLLDESDANVLMVDRHAQPGGHWNDAYPFVRLHQPSAFYGVNSRVLGSGRMDESEWGGGLYELASGAEIVCYFDQLMHQRFLPSGRVHYFPMHNYEGNRSDSHCITSLLTGDSKPVQVRRKLVDATIAQTAVPSTHSPHYRVAPGIRCIPLNDLPKISQPYLRYVVVGRQDRHRCLSVATAERGGGKQDSVDRSKHFLAVGSRQHSAGPGEFCPNDRQPCEPVRSHRRCRFDPRSVPQARECWRTTAHRQNHRTHRIPRCDGVAGELHALRGISDVVHLGRVRAIETNGISLEKGSIAGNSDALYIDCSASAIPTIPEGSVKAFDGDRINLVTVSSYQILFSAAVIAYVESHLDDQAQMNALCGVVPVPHSPVDWIKMWVAYLDNQRQWKHHAGLSNWLAQCRLHLLPSVLRSLQEGDPEKLAVLNRFAQARQSAFWKFAQDFAGNRRFNTKDLSDWMGSA